MSFHAATIAQQQGFGGGPVVCTETALQLSNSLLTKAIELSADGPESSPLPDLDCCWMSQKHLSGNAGAAEILRVVKFTRVARPFRKTQSPDEFHGVAPADAFCCVSVNPDAAQPPNREGTTIRKEPRGVEQKSRSWTVDFGGADGGITDGVERWDAGNCAA